MIEIIIAIVLAVILWNLRSAFYSKSAVFKEQIDISVKTSEVELQDNYKELVELVADKKTEQNGKWFSMRDVERSMASDTKPTEDQ